VDGQPELDDVSASGWKKRARRRSSTAKPPLPSSSSSLSCAALLARKHVWDTHAHLSRFREKQPVGREEEGPSFAGVARLRKPPRGNQRREEKRPPPSFKVRCAREERSMTAVGEAEEEEEKGCQGRWRREGISSFDFAI